MKRKNHLSGRKQIPKVELSRPFQYDYTAGFVPLPKLQVEIPFEYMEQAQELEEDSSVFEKIWYILKYGIKYLHVLYIIVKFIARLKMAENIKDKKTNYSKIIASVLGALQIILAIFGVDAGLDSNTVIMLSGALSSILAFVIAQIAHWTGKKSPDEK